jgi:hypothetical protein
MPIKKQMDKSFWQRINKQCASHSNSAKQQIIPHPPSPLLEAKEPYQCRILTPDDIDAICKLLYTEFHYAYLKSTPDMKIDPAWLLNDMSNGAYGIGCYVNKTPVACIWARPIGKIGFNSSAQPILDSIYIAEHLCVATAHRGKGLTRILLNWIVFHRPTPETRFIFLKEGKAVPTNYICWDSYVYTRIVGKVVPNRRNIPIIIRKRQCRQITIEEALKIRNEITKDTTDILWNTPDMHVPCTRTQLWLWRDKALMAITETHQCHPLDGRPIGLVTGWICSKDATPVDRSIAQEDIFKAQPFTWLWSAKSQIEENNREWFNDGMLWWQPYLWNAAVHPQNLFLIL